MARISKSYMPRLVVMVKTPRAGRVKTRLSADIGVSAATNFYRTMASNIVRRVGADARWETVLAVAPDVHVADRFWPSHLPRVGQGNGDLGERMQRVMDTMPPGPVVIIGADIPEITPVQIAAAFETLGSHDSVFGPADDGGYWLVGLKRTPSIPDIFRDVRWSTVDTLSDTLANMKTLKNGQLGILRDIDTGKEHRELSDKACRLVIS